MAEHIISRLLMNEMFTMSLVLLAASFNLVMKHIVLIVILVPLLFMILSNAIAGGLVTFDN